jgi:Ca2+-binding EF-hand superfamily protein
MVRNFCLEFHCKSLTPCLVLTSLGEKLSDDEVEELLKGVNVGKDGSINYTGNTQPSVFSR